MNESFLNISTTDSQQIDQWRGPVTARARHNDNRAYASPDYYYLFKVIRLLRLAKDDVVYDIGCGKGRVLCLVARQEIKKCIGIEILEDLCKSARQNADRLRGRRSLIEIRHEDAARADVSDGTVFFLFNPFGQETMSEVVANIAGSLAKNPRRIKIVYFNSVHQEVLNACNYLRLFRSFQTFSGKRVQFYEHVPEANLGLPHRVKRPARHAQPAESN